MQAFERSGLATLDDLDTDRWRERFNTLEAIQAEFLAHEAAIRTGAYAWERDPLHGWSRCWEYPYHFHHLAKWRATHNGPAPAVVDLGSGVTFFPFTVARLGCDVLCVDPDPVAETEVARAASAMPSAPGSVRFAAGACAAIPLPDASADAVYCVSVLEHVDEPEKAVPEVARVLKPGGLFVLSIDVDLIGTMAIGPEKFKQLMELLHTDFDWVAPERTIHPRRVLDCFAGPYARSHERQVPGLMWRRADGSFAPLIGGPIARDPMQLTVYAATMRRR